MELTRSGDHEASVSCGHQATAIALFVTFGSVSAQEVFTGCWGHAGRALGWFKKRPPDAPHEKPAGTIPGTIWISATCWLPVATRKQPRDPLAAQGPGGEAGIRTLRPRVSKLMMTRDFWF